MKYFFSSQGMGPETGIGVIRIIVGAFMIYHGWEVFTKDAMDGYAKWLTELKFPLPALMAYLGKGAEFVAGIMLTLGFLTRIAAIALIATMAGICFGMGHGKVWADDQHPFLFILLCFVFIFFGPGRFSIDKVIFRKKEPRIAVS